MFRRPPASPLRSSRRPWRTACALAAGGGIALLAACGAAPASDTASTTPPFSNPIRSAVPATGTSTTTRPTNGAPTTVDAPSPERDAAWTSEPLDGPIDGRPVAFGSLLVVATRANSLYGLDQASGAIVWGPATIGPAVLGAHLHELGVPASCAVPDSVGISSAPTIDLATGTVYAVASVQTPTDPVPVHQIAAFDAATGAPVGAPRSVDPPAANRALLWQRAALVAANGYVYVAFGGYAPRCGDAHGWVVAAPVAAAAATPMRSFQVAADPGGPGHGGGIIAPSGPVVGGDGTVYVATGPGIDVPADPRYDRSNSVLALSPTLDELGFWAPSTWRTDGAQLLDVGAAGPLRLPDGRLFQIGTNATGVVLDTTRPENPLGGIGGQAASLAVCPASGGTAYADPSVFVSCADGVRAVKLDLGSKPPVLKALWQSTKATGIPIVDGTLVWAVSPETQSLVGIVRESGQLVTVVKTGPVSRTTTPLAVNDRVFVASENRIVAVSSGAKGTGEGQAGDGSPDAPAPDPGPVTGG
jgi:polyvinyl alcohol dehydrogenase (cytochrome)